jgi:hypothetical protein
MWNFLESFKKPPSELKGKVTINISVISNYDIRFYAMISTKINGFPSSNGNFNVIAKAVAPRRTSIICVTICILLLILL